jgi:hypothetical protein
MNLFFVKIFVHNNHATASQQQGLFRVLHIRVNKTQRQDTETGGFERQDCNGIGQCVSGPLPVTLRRRRTQFAEGLSINHLIASAMRSYNTRNLVEAPFSMRSSSRLGTAIHLSLSQSAIIILRSQPQQITRTRRYTVEHLLKASSRGIGSDKRNMSGICACSMISKQKPAQLHLKTSATIWAHLLAPSRASHSYHLRPVGHSQHPNTER